MPAIWSYGRCWGMPVIPRITSEKNKGVGHCGYANVNWTESTTLDRFRDATRTRVDNCCSPDRASQARRRNATMSFKKRRSFIGLRCARSVEQAIGFATRRDVDACGCVRPLGRVTANRGRRAQHRAMCGV